MITHISIENFKGIRERVELELKPITLLFGPNSAGKSAILHALLYAQEIFERHNLDADTTAAGGPFIDLGGFKNMVHGHDLNQPITLGFRFSLDEDEFQPYKHDVGAFADLLECADLLDCDDEALSELISRPSSAGMFVKIRWSKDSGRPFVQSCRFELDSQDFAEIIHDLASDQTSLRLPRLDHPLLDRPDRDETDSESLVKEQSPDCMGKWPSRRQCSILHSTLEEVSCCFQSTSREGITEFSLAKQTDALLDGGASVRFELTRLPRAPATDESYRRTRTGVAVVGLPPGLRMHVAREVATFLDSIIANILQTLRKRLDDFRYLGPVREIPTRNATPPTSPDPGRWSTGLGAWDHLQKCPEEFVRLVSDWLSSPARLNAGVQLVREAWISSDEAQRIVAEHFGGRRKQKAPEEIQRRLKESPPERRLFLVPRGSQTRHSLHDVGIGISQLVPVVVTALDKQARLAAIEEPGYHLHPRVSAEIGDLLIEAASGGGRLLLVETHREHLLLRLLRRIRETAECDRIDGTLALHPEQLAVFYIQKQNEAVHVRPLRATHEGDFAGPWPEGFFDERAKELF